MKLDDKSQYLNAISLFKFKINTTTLLAGIKYIYDASPSFVYTSWDGTRREISASVYHRLNLISGAEFIIVPWLKMRLAISLLSYTKSKGDYAYTDFEYRPYFHGGLGFRITPALDLGINLSATSYSPMYGPEMSANFELSYIFN